MQFPTKYLALSRNSFTDKEASIVPIRYQDRQLIMKWRNEQMYHLRQKTPLTEQNQEDYFKNVVSKLFSEDKPSQLLFSYLNNDKLVGYGGLVHINWEDKNAEISFLLDTSIDENKSSEHWLTFLKIIGQIAFEDLKLHKINTYAFDIRSYLYPFFEEADFYQEARLKEHCIIDGSYRDIVIHSKITDINND